VPPFAGAAVGHPLATVAVSGTGGGVNTSEADGVLALADEVSVSEPHAASVKTNDAAQATNAKEDDTRVVFTVVTLQPHPGLLACGPRDVDDGSTGPTSRAEGRCQNHWAAMHHGDPTGNPPYSIAPYSILGH
jgi:hypothetical protein